MSKKEIYIVYDDEKASAKLKENGNLIKTVTIKKDVDRNRDSYEMLCTIRNELFKEDTKFKIGDRVRFKDYININRQFDFHNMFINDTSAAINFRKMFIELEGKPNDCTFKETWLLDNGQQYEIAYSYTDINNHRNRKIRNEFMEIHNAAPLYKTKAVYPESAYFFLMKEIQKKNKGGI